MTLVANICIFVVVFRYALMKIIIAGGGEVGFHLAKLLSFESLDIILIDTDKDRLNYAESHLDIRGYPRQCDVIGVNGRSTSGQFRFVYCSYF